MGEENAKKYKTLVFLAGSASAEFFADLGLCPFEAVKVPFSNLQFVACLLARARFNFQYFSILLRFSVAVLN